VDERQLPARVYRLDLASGRRETWKELMPGDLAGLGIVNAVAISRDGETVLFNYGRSLADLFLAEGLK
jgi:sugar lactone lactonase YvrE